MEKLTLSINPSYNCNFNCEFCYLRGLSTSELLSLDKLVDILKNLKAKYEIVDIDLYGGEIMLLPDDYMRKMLDIVSIYVEKTSIITNLSIIKPWLLIRNDIDIVVSWDYIFRPDYKKTLSRIEEVNLKYGREMSILLTHPRLNEYKYQIVEILNNMKGNYSIEVKPAFATKGNVLGKNNFKNFQELTKYLLFNLNDKFNNINYYLLNNPPNNLKHKHCFITPDGKIKDIFYKDGLEYFSDASLEESRECSDCYYKNNCLSEHQFYQDDYDCSGHIKLIETYNKWGNLKQLHWRKRREISYIKNNFDFGDSDLPTTYIDEDEKLLENRIDSYFNDRSELVYPAKSYYVAIIYAYLLNKYFGEDILHALDYEDLLGKDQMFVRYSDNKKMYDKLLKKHLLNLENGVYNIDSTYNYFIKEFLLNV